MSQLTLDEELKRKTRLPGPDGWKASNVYQHYGILYGVQMIPSSVRGEWVIRNVQVKSENELPDTDKTLTD